MFAIDRLARIVSIALCLVAYQAQSAPVTAYGADVSFTYDDASLYGEINIVGNNFFFDPTAFSAQSLNGAGAVVTSQTLEITVTVTTPGFLLTDFSMDESGDYFGTGGTSQANGRLGVVSLTQTANDEDLFDTGLLVPLVTKSPWSTTAAVDLADTAGWGSDTSVKLSLQNELAATTVLLSGTNSTIQKKLVNVGVNGVTTVVPVPAAAWLFGSALIGLMGIRRRAA